MRLYGRIRPRELAFTQRGSRASQTGSHGVTEGKGSARIVPLGTTTILPDSSYSGIDPRVRNTTRTFYKFSTKRILRFYDTSEV